MSDSLFPIAGDMTAIGEYVAAWVVFGIGLTVVFWTLGYTVWFLIQLFR